MTATPDQPIHITNDGITIAGQPLEACISADAGITIGPATADGLRTVAITLLVDEDKVTFDDTLITAGTLATGQVKVWPEHLVG
ncbi:hypothetical protein CH302_01010 [Rhodococcus sp. 15-2388-1-1a]|uniref:hypothetical protein n=1 Tax=Nocardiaceae TaxID=85025 RepID=UPI000565664D|nr:MULTISPECIES: hypothetical protein [Rhodococcus]OZF05234.1 hypothetical protein CH302_01010 [Rhodococcus sp. 15-2388-1-1a]